jgi:amino-acid N-acetyltransferase
MRMLMAIEPARAADYEPIAALLVANQLPVAGFRECLANALVVRDGERIVAAAALETYPSGVLLRSVVVDARLRGSGLGGRLTKAALALARQLHAPAAYLLTTTAGEFFPQFGFAPISRGDVPIDVRQSVEFTSACPASALVMRVGL